MKRKIMLLIGACIFTVVALTAIQGYFIYNTYQLTEKEVSAKIKKQLIELEDTEEWYELNDSWMNQSGEFVKNYAFGRLHKKDFIRFMKSKSDSLSGIMKAYMDKHKKPGDFDIGYSIYITSITITDDKKTDSIYSGKLFVLGNNVKNKGEVVASTGRWEGEKEYVDNSVSPMVRKGLDFEIKSERYYSIANWEQTIISQMAGLLIFSVLLMVFVVYLYYLSLKNLVNQKRIADIKTDFVNNITHEFQTPLATMDIAIKTLQRKENEMSPEHYKSTLSLLERQNDRLQKLFRQVTEASVSPVANTQAEIRISCGEIKEMIEDFKLSKPNTLINCHQTKDDITVRIDRFHLNTILVNLLDNAVKYGATQIDIELDATEKNFSLGIRDNGRGIPVKEHNAIFDKFYRVEKGNIHDSKGLGLGLFYVKQLVETYKGNLKVESEENKGALFLITIPL